MSEDVVVVGASVSTTAFLERVREIGETRRIVVIDGDPDAPYDRPPLSKHFLIEGDADDIQVDWDDLNATLVRAWAVAVHPADHVVRIRDEAGVESDVMYGTLVIATGATPARLPIEPRDTLTLRSAEDARSLRALTKGREDAIIIGAGAIGVELASSLAARGSRVTLLDRASGPLERLLAGHLAAEASRWLEAAGVDCRWSVDITSIERFGGAWRVDMGDGSRLGADVLISAVGARPAVAWLDGSGLLTDRALVVDERGRVTTNGGVVRDVFGIGDAITRRKGDGTMERTESWAAARQHGTHLADDLFGGEREPEPRPYFWTEVAGRKVQVVGTLHPDMELEVEYENQERGAVLYRATNQQTEAWIGVNAQPRIAKLLIAATQSA